MAKLNSDATSLTYSTFIGGDGDETAYAIAVDSSGNAYITGVTSDATTDFPTSSDAYDSAIGGDDAFVVKFNSTGTSLLYSTYVGDPTLADQGYGIALDSSNNIYVAGYSGGDSFPTTAGAYDTSSNGGGDAVVFKFTSLYTWDGSSSTDWGTAANWDVNAVPAANDDVTVADVSNDPIVDATRSVNALTINSSAILDLNGTTFTLGSTFTNNGSLKLTGGETLSGFTNDTDTGTVNYAGTGTYTSLVAGNSYYNLTISGTGSYTLGAAVDVNNTFTQSAGTFDVSTSNYGVTVGGSFTRNGGTFTPRSGTVTFDSTSTGNTITSNSASFYDLTFNGVGGAWTLADAMDVNNNLTITNGTLDVSTSNYGINLAGNFSSAGTFTSRSGTVTLDGTSTGKTITSGGASFYNLTLNGVGGAWTLADALDVNNNLTITNGTLDVSTSNYGINLVGNFSNAGTFTSRSGTVTLDGTATGKTITSGGASFYNLTLNGTGGAWTLADALDVNNNLTITNGTLDVSTSNYGITLAGNFANSGTFTARSGTVTFDGSGTSIISGSTSFYNFTSTTAGKAITFTASTTQTITGTLTLTGASGSLIVLRSSTSGTQWSINPQGTRSVSYVDVLDSNNTNSTVIDPTNSTNSGNNTNWFTVASSSDTSDKEVEDSVKGTDKGVDIIILLVEVKDEGAGSLVDVSGGGDLVAKEEVSKEEAPAKEAGKEKEEAKKEEAKKEDKEAKKEDKEAKKEGEDEAKKEGEEAKEGKEAGEKSAYEETDEVKYKKLYESGKYRTVVIVFEGRVAVAPYDEKGIKDTDSVFLSAGQKLAQEGEVM